MADNSFFDEEGAIEFVNNEAVKATDTIQVFAKFKNSKSRLLPNNTVAVYLGNKKGVEKVVIPSTALMYDEDSPMCLYSTTITSLNAGTYPSVAWTAGGSS